MVQQPGHQVACAEQARPDAGLGNSQHGGNLDAVQFLERRQRDHLALLVRELLHATENMGVVLGGGSSLLGTETFAR